jgi:TldD protein
VLDLSNKVLKLAAAADWAEVRVEKAEGNSVILKNGNPDAAGFDRSLGIAIRVLVKGGMGIAFTNRFDQASLQAAVDKSLKTAKASSKGLRKPVVLAPQKAQTADYSADCKVRPADIDSSEKLALLMDIDSALLATKVKLPARMLQIDDSTREQWLVNSEGTSIHSTIPRLCFTYLLTAENNGDTEQRMRELGATGGWELVKQWKLEQQLTDEARMLARILTAPRAADGVMDIVIGPEITGIAAHESVGHPQEADRILGREAAQAGEAYLNAEDMGLKIGSPVVNVVDDPTVRGSYGWYRYDDEGVQAQRRPLISAGKVVGFLQDRRSASHWGIHSNGSCRASAWDREPIVRMSTTQVVPGDQSIDELLEGVKRGIWIKTYMEWNIDDKRFNQRYVGLEAWNVLNGEPTTLVRRPALELTTPAFWSAVDAVGKDLDWATGHCGKGDPMQGVPVWFGGPSMRLRNIRLGMRPEAKV